MDREREGQIGLGTKTALNIQGRAIRQPRASAPGGRRRTRQKKPLGARAAERIHREMHSQILARAKTVRMTFNSRTADPEYTYVLDHQVQAEADELEARNRLSAAIDTLEPKLRAVVRARRNQRSLSEIAAQQRIRPSTAWDRLQTALKALQEMVRPEHFRILVEGIAESEYVLQRNAPWGDREGKVKTDMTRRRDSDKDEYVDERNKDSELYGDGVSGVYVTGRKHKRVRQVK